MVIFENAGECLYRHTSTVKYDGRFEVNGCKLPRSLDATDRVLAKRKLADLQRATACTTRQMTRVADKPPVEILLAVLGSGFG